jgi:transcriptional regulator
MYRPAAYVDDDAASLHAIIRDRSFATIAASIDGQIHFAYAPVVLDASAGPRGGIRFHLAKANPLASLDASPVRLSFLGPDTYVSPDWYASEGLVPTWNYVAIEAAGVAQRMDGQQLRALLVDLSASQEERLKPKKPWTLDKVPAAKLDGLLNAIVGFSVVLETLEGKFKLSQDKRKVDFDGVVEGLEASGDHRSREVAAAMRKAPRLGE